MKSVDCYRLLITPLSPVHVGTGESYEPTNYVIEEGVLHEFDTGAVMEALSAADRKALLDIGNRKPDLRMIQAVQRFFFERRAALMAHAAQRIPVLPGVANLYADRVGQVANREAGGGVVLNRLEIDRTSFNPVTRLPVLFGSSLKGAVRTALLDRVNSGARAQEQKGLHEFQGRLFRYYDPEAKPRLSLELDPMRLVQLSDASWSGEPGLTATQVYLAVNRKKAPVKDQQGNIRKSQAESKDLYQILECVPGMRYRAFSGQINFQTVEGIDEQDRQHNRQLPAASLRLDVKRIARDCNAFYRPILQAENQLLSERGYLDQKWSKTVETLLSSMRDNVERGEVFLLRVGRHSGAESVTLNGVRSIKIMEGKGPDGKSRFSTSNLPKTVWLAAEEKDQSRNLLPFGWVLVEVLPLDAPIADRPGLKAACEPHLTSARSFANKLAERQARFAAAREEAETRHRKEKERERQAEEEAARRAREEEEKKSRLATMTENMRRVEQFKDECAMRVEQLRGGKDRPYTQFYEKARQLAAAALGSADWTPEEKRAAHDAITEWLPKIMAVDMKQVRKKLNLDLLRGES